jgi:Flp pilus assembly pilin Flp
MLKLKRAIKEYLIAQDGATAIEYSLIAAAISLAIIGGFPNLSGAVKNKILLISNSITTLT